MTEKKMQLVDWLDDLCVRFIINLPREELESVERICFQVEEAQWFYEDFIRPLDPDLPPLNLRNFCLLIFQHCPMLSAYSSYDHAQAFSEFLAYKTRVPVRGAILLNGKMDEVLLVKGWKKGANWSFPRGKINKDEPDLDCAIREVYEETGYDIDGAGLVGNAEETKYIEMNLREQNMRLYVFRNVPRDTYFEPQTRKEISKIAWWKLGDLPTLKKKKQQESQGAELANNANKFYMVAPFLTQLKKWISAQRKLDRTTRQKSVSASVPIFTDEEATAVEDPELDEAADQPTVNGDMGKLLEGLRQSAQPVSASNYAENIADATATGDVATQLKSFLGVPTNPSVTHEGAKRVPSPERASDPNANDLLALLQSKPPQPMQPPPTPLEQVIENPNLPSSPPHLHSQPQRFSSMPPPPAFPTQDQMLAVHDPRLQQPQPPQVRAIPPPQQPAQLVPRNTHLQHTKPPPPTARVNRQIVAPYQRTGDPQFAQNAQAPSNQPSSIPRASKLPPPKLNAQTSALLNLFKSGPPAKAADSPSDTRVPSRATQRAGSESSTMNIIRDPEAPRTPESIVHNPSQEKPRQPSRSTEMFVPPQVLSRPQSEKAKETSKLNAGHHDKLLGLFRSPSTATSAPPQPAPPTLQLPTAPIELSALPTTPGHSREPSRNDRPVEGQAPLTGREEFVGSEKRSRRATASQQNPPVSATINGPLNIPQFDLVAKVSKETRQVVNRKDRSPSTKRSPITILARPTSSQGLKDQPLVASQTNSTAPKLQTFVTPIKKPPPTPDLKAHEVPPRPFQPQILRRPAHLDEPTEPSPIQPLPSPKHNSLLDRRPTQPTDNKKSLLSLFTQASPVISPPSGAVPASAIDPSALISPLAGPSPKEQADAAFARLTRSVGKLSHEADDAMPVTAQLPLPLSRTPSNYPDGPDDIKPGGGSGKQTPKLTTTNTSKTTPVDKAFLLEFLNSVAEGGK